jgi:hypothetical protein
MLRNYGQLTNGTQNLTNVYGIAYWGGSVYGFTVSGQLFEVIPNGMSISTQLITIPNAPSNLSFNGAGSSTSVPVAAMDGGKFVID